MLWVLVWLVLVLAALAVLAFQARSLYRRGAALVKELGAATAALQAAAEALPRPTPPEQPAAVFDDPVALRRARKKQRRRLRRGRPGDRRAIGGTGRRAAT